MEPSGQSIQKCLNCGHELPEGAKYCPACSQKVSDVKVSIKNFIFEFLDTLFSLDSRVWRTLRDIWIPGKLTLKYFEGKHKTYMHPLRLFFILAIIHFAIISYRTGNIVTESLAEGPAYLKKEQIESDYFKKIDSLSKEVKKGFGGQASVEKAIDSLMVLSKESVDTFNSSNEFVFSSITNKDGEKIEVPFIEYYKYSYEELQDKYEITGFFPRMFLKQQYRAANNPDQMYKAFMANLIWMVFLMMPAIALVLKLFYIRRDRYFVEHLVFSFHFHAFSFLLISPFYLFLSENQFGNILIPFITILIYLIVMMKRYYQQGWMKTFFKWFLLLNAYALLVILFLLGGLFVSFLQI